MSKSNTEVAAPCRRCGEPSRRAHVATDRNRAMSGDRFTYQRCIACGVVWLLEVPEDVASYYPTGYHDLPTAAELPRDAQAESFRLGLITDRVEPGRMVEIGPSNGVFAFAAQKRGFEVTGLEMDPGCCQHLVDVVGASAINTAEPEQALMTLPPSRAIVMWHVLEHVPDPWALITAVAQNLEPGGVFALATPNPGSVQYRVFRGQWVHLDAPRHLTLIPLATLRDEADECGLRLVHVTDRDPVGLNCDAMGWERSIASAPALRADPRFVHTIGKTLTALARPLERRGLRGSTYTAVLQKTEDGLTRLCTDEHKPGGRRAPAAPSTT